MRQSFSFKWASTTNRRWRWNSLNLLLIGNNDIKGVTINNEDHKISLCAADTILYLTEPNLTISYLKNLILDYGYYSSYKVNIDKTEAMDINGTIPENIKVQSEFKWSKVGIKYLGIFIPIPLDHLFEKNYNKIIQHISNDLEQWSILVLSLMS